MAKINFALLAVAGLVLVVSFQNCSDVKFATAIDPLANKSGGNTATDIGDGTVSIPAQPDPNSLPDDPTDEETDYDHEGRKVVFKCSTGADLNLDFSQDLSKAQDYLIRNSFLPKAIEQARNITAETVQGSLIVKMAEAIVSVRNIHGVETRLMGQRIYGVSEIHAALAAMRTLRLDKMEKVHAAVASASTLEADEISEIQAAFVCLSGERIQRIHHVQSAFMKIAGRKNNQQKSSLGELTHVQGFVSLARLDVAKIQNVNGHIIIRDGEIDEISDVQGSISLINVRVKSLKNVRGILRLKNSEVLQSDNISGMSVVQLK